MSRDVRPLPLKTVVDQVVELMRERITKYGLTLSQRISDDLVVAADERMLKQILFNLLSNAIKFTPSGGSVALSAERLSGEVRICVADTGIGIAAENLELVFAPFEQVDSTLSRKHQGTGLGLTLCRRFVEMHGGRIWAESEGADRGSTLIFTLPVPPAADKTRAS